ncbi:MAG: hypothetical protein LBK61_04980 [Spirochaetaceae bacterium]|jgi:hypothetical protein|nr:hypothetical protein [Spirochaetaceae bacterium]
MKKCLTAVIVLFCVSFALYAQNRVTPQKPAKTTYFSVGMGTFIFNVPGLKPPPLGGQLSAVEKAGMLG